MVVSSPLWGDDLAHREAQHPCYPSSVPFTRILEIRENADYLKSAHLRETQLVPFLQPVRHFQQRLWIRPGYLPS